MGPRDAPTLSALADIVGPRHVVTDPEVLAGSTVDWTGRFTGTTSALVRPGSTDEVAGVVSLCRERGLPVTLQGGNTGLVGGGVPLSGELLVSLSSARRGLHRRTDGPGHGGRRLHHRRPPGGRPSAARGPTAWTWAAGTAPPSAARWPPTPAASGWSATATRGPSCWGSRRCSGPAPSSPTSPACSRTTPATTCPGSCAAARAPSGWSRRPGCGWRRGPPSSRGRPARLRRRPRTRSTPPWPCAGTSPPSRRPSSSWPRGWSWSARSGRSARPSTGPTAPTSWSRRPPPPTRPTSWPRHWPRAGRGRQRVATEPARRAELWRYREAAHRGDQHPGSAPQARRHPARRGTWPDSSPGCPTVVRGVAPGARVWLFGHAADGNVHVNVTGVARDDESVDEAVLSRRGGRPAAASAPSTGSGRPSGAGSTGAAARAEIAAFRAIKGALDPDGILNPHVLLP